jgi:hypothetical protein
LNRRAQRTLITIVWNLEGEAPAVLVDLYKSLDRVETENGTFVNLSVSEVRDDHGRLTGWAVRGEPAA